MPYAECFPSEEIRKFISDDRTHRRGIRPIAWPNRLLFCPHTGSIRIMRLNDIANQYAALSEISVRTQDNDLRTAANQTNESSLSAVGPSTNAQYDRQLERARSIASERAEQSNDDYLTAQRREEAIRDSGDQSRELQNILDRVREGDVADDEREALQERFDEIISRFDNAPEQTENSNGEEGASSFPVSTVSTSPSHRQARNWAAAPASALKTSMPYVGSISPKHPPRISNRQAQWLKAAKTPSPSASAKPTSRWSHYATSAMFLPM